MIFHSIKRKSKDEFLIETAVTGMEALTKEMTFDLSRQISGLIAKEAAEELYPEVMKLVDVRTVAMFLHPELARAISGYR